MLLMVLSYALLADMPLGNMVLSCMFLGYILLTDMVLSDTLLSYIFLLSVFSHSLSMKMDLNIILMRAEELFYKYCRKSVIDCFQVIDMETI